MRNMAAEFFGTFWLVFGGCGSAVLAAAFPELGIGFAGVALAFGLTVLTMAHALGPVSGGHFNPAVTAVFVARGELQVREAAAYVLAQLAGAVLGVLLAHAMFDLPVLQLSQKIRSGLAQGFSEWVATFGLVLTILLTLRTRAEAVATSVGLYIMAAYWFTASTSFANPAVTIARALSDTFAGIRPGDVPMFVAAQLAGAFCALAALHILVNDRKPILSGAERAPAEQA